MFVHCVQKFVEIQRKDRILLPAALREAQAAGI